MFLELFFRDGEKVGEKSFESELLFGNVEGDFWGEGNNRIPTVCKWLCFNRNRERRIDCCVFCNVEEELDKLEEEECS